MAIFGNLSSFHNNRASKGDKGNSITGEPKIPCNFKGNGKTAAPKTEKEKVRIRMSGSNVSLLSLAILHKPIQKSMLKTAHTTKPTVKIYRVLVPMAPSSLTMFENGL